MSGQSDQRKLAAILSADVVGYSRLMGDDEAATVHTLTAFREIMARLIGESRGRVVDAPGDNLLAEFASAVDAVKCALSIQEALQEQNETLPQKRRMHFRIGINVGDVIEQAGSLYGDGVNLAARIESLAAPGGISVSGTVYDQVKNKLDLAFKFQGEQRVKNIKDPVRVYQVGPAQEGGSRTMAAPGSRRRLALALAGAVVLAALGAAAWLYMGQKPFLPDKSTAALPLPKVPSLAVLPFNNLSKDPGQGYLADGLTESIITALAKLPRLFVIARNSSFTYKGKAVKVRRVGRELGVRYVLEGSVQRAGDNVRVAAQLIDAQTGRHLWSQKYDRPFKKLFALQDDITLKITKALEIELTSGEQARLWHRSTSNLEAWGLVVKGTPLFVHLTQQDNARARELFQQVVKLDPKYAFAWTMLAWTHLMDARQGWGADRRESFKKALLLAVKSLKLDDTLSDTYALLGTAHMMRGQHERSIAAFKKAIVLGPNSATSHVLFSWALTYAGRPHEAVAMARRAMRLYPHFPAFFLFHLGNALCMAGNYQQALAVLKRLEVRSQKGRFSPLITYLLLTEVYAELGRMKQARAHAKQVLSLDPKFRPRSVFKFENYKNPQDLQRRLKALAKAGLK